VVTYSPVGLNNVHELVGYWVMSYRRDNACKLGMRDLERKRITMRPWQTISATMIVRDAEDDLTRCLKSFAWAVDELVIVDTGSKDNTVEVAKKFTSHVYSIEWPEDFAAARNYGLDRCTGDWIFWIDADEVIVNPGKLRRYAQSRLYNGFVVRQNHLMLDFKAEPDVPIRFFRNKDEYKFYGVIHEHCEAEMDEPILPAMVCPDVDIAHFGYLNEPQRRHKCSERNLALLAKDREVNPGRKLGWVLFMRDYINLTNWELESNRGAFSQKAIEYLRSCIETFLTNLEEGDRLYPIAFPIYQNALALLGRAGVPINDEVEYPPFELALTLAAGFGGLPIPKGGKAEPDRRWFGTFEEQEAFLNLRTKTLRETLMRSGDSEWLL